MTVILPTDASYLCYILWNIDMIMKWHEQMVLKMCLTAKNFHKYLIELHEIAHVASLG